LWCNASLTSFKQLTNTLQKKLDQVKKEKAALEKQIEREQLSHEALEQRLNTIQTSKRNKSIEESIEECDDEGDVDDSILPDMAAHGEHADDPLY
jgi:predicted  nucleic acid-binding Zn-ribbon protein